MIFARFLVFERELKILKTGFYFKSAEESEDLILQGLFFLHLTDKNKFKMLQIMSPEVAAGKMFSNMNKNSFSSSFPAPFSWLFRVSQLLPDSIYFKLF